MVDRAKPKEPSDDQRIGAAIRRFRHDKRLTQQEAADRLEAALLTWQRYERGERSLGMDKLTAVARALGISRRDILDEAGIVEVEPDGLRAIARDRIIRSATPTLPVRDRVQAGAWLMADDHGQDEPRRETAVRDLRYGHADQWLDEVVGDSVDLLRIFDGDLIHCVDVVGAGYTPKTGDIVEVERMRFGGQERELTVKQVEVLDDGVVLLWPRSTNPRWRDPLPLSDVPEHEVEVRIRGLVVRTIRRLA